MIRDWTAIRGLADITWVYERLIRVKHAPLNRRSAFSLGMRLQISDRLIRISAPEWQFVRGASHDWRIIPSDAHMRRLNPNVSNWRGRPTGFKFILGMCPRLPRSSAMSASTSFRIDFPRWSRLGRPCCRALLANSSLYSGWSNVFEQRKGSNLPHLVGQK